MQDSGSGFDWAHALSALAGGVLGALGTIVAWVYKAGGREPSLRLDFQKGLDETEKRLETKVDDMTGHFHEYFEGIRRQQDELKLTTERDFVRKDDFKEFRGEYRENTRRIFELLDSLPRHK